MQEFALSYDKERLVYCGNKHLDADDFLIASTRGGVFRKMKEREIAALRELQAPQFCWNLSLMGAGGRIIADEALWLYRSLKFSLINQERHSLGLGMIQLLRLWLLSQSYEEQARKYENGVSESGSIQESAGGIKPSRNKRASASLKHTLQRQLVLLRSMDVTEPKDKIYSLRGLFQGPGRDYRLDSHDPNILIVKYGESIAKVYASLVRAIVIPTRRLDIFQGCSRIKANDLPSWVPDWRINEATNAAGKNYLYKASSETGAQFSFSEDPSTMTVKGFVWDEMRVSGDNKLCSQSNMSQCA